MAEKNPSDRAYEEYIARQRNQGAAPRPYSAPPFEPPTSSRPRPTPPVTTHRPGGCSRVPFVLLLVVGISAMQFVCRMGNPFGPKKRPPPPPAQFQPGPDPAGRDADDPPPVIFEFDQDRPNGPRIRMRPDFEAVPRGEPGDGGLVPPEGASTPPGVGSSTDEPPLESTSTTEIEPPFGEPVTP